MGVNHGATFLAKVLKWLQGPLTLSELDSPDLEPCLVLRLQNSKLKHKHIDVLVNKRSLKASFKFRCNFQVLTLQTCTCGARLIICEETTKSNVFIKPTDRCRSPWTNPCKSHRSLQPSPQYRSSSHRHDLRIRRVEKTRTPSMSVVPIIDTQKPQR